MRHRDPPDRATSYTTKTTTATTTTTRLCMTAPEPLATEGDWSAYLDEASTGLVYYFNIRCVSV